MNICFNNLYILGGHILAIHLAIHLAIPLAIPLASHLASHLAKQIAKQMAMIEALHFCSPKRLANL